MRYSLGSNGKTPVSGTKARFVMIMNLAVLAAVIVTAAILLMPRIANSKTWRATVTPLASIIGSGFLILGPVLSRDFGYGAIGVMAGLCLVAYAFGHCIRCNIVARASGGAQPGSIARLEQMAAWVLAFAYVISVAYYLNLFGAFAVSLTPLDAPVYARAVTSIVLALIGTVGYVRGFSALERMEEVSVGIKLSVIAGLLAGLAIYFAGLGYGHSLMFSAPSVTGWRALFIAFGLVVTVQGFEISRYLGDEYDVPTRVATMRYAQILSALIYMVYIGLVAFSFPAKGIGTSETAIITMTAVVAPVLPLLLVAAALSAQFSAAIADAGGSGGLVHEASGRRIKARVVYVVIVLAGIFITWTLNIYSIIAYASRAFALYYGLQAAIAFVYLRRDKRPWYRLAIAAGMCLLGLAIAVLGIPAE